MKLRRMLCQETGLVGHKPASGRWQVAGGWCQVADGRWRVAGGRCGTCVLPVLKAELCHLSSFSCNASLPFGHFTRRQSIFFTNGCDEAAAVAGFRIEIRFVCVLFVPAMHTGEL